MIGWWRRWWGKEDQPGPRHLATGRWGESVAETFLTDLGYRILGRRVRIGRRDELDLIARSPDEVLVFVEVKTRASEFMGRPYAAVTEHKKTHLIRAAIGYMKKLRSPPKYFRFDVVEVIGTEGSEVQPEVRHIENAFQMNRNLRMYQP